MIKIAENIWEEENLLSLEECKLLISRAENLKFREARLQNSGRQNSEVFLNNSFAYKRIHEKLFTNDKLLILGPLLECYRYKKGDYLTPHSDAPRDLGNGIWSVFTLIVYLNDNFRGGETRFVESNLKTVPRTGKSILFSHDLTHEALTVLEGIKYIVRIDVGKKQSTDVRSG